MITFFTTVRPFVGEFDHLQRVAIGSWLTAAPGSEVYVFGDREGAAAACDELGAIYVPNTPTNAQGTELFNAPFVEMATRGQYRWLCEISADIVLGADIAPAIDALRGHSDPFVIGQRRDVNREGFLLIGVSPSPRAVLHPPSAVDYFLYPRGAFPPRDIPPFAVGRTAYDNWMVWAALKRWGLTVIDATDAITAIHVNHGYPEWADGKDEMLKSAERDENHRLARETGCTRWYGINDAPYVLRGGRVRWRG